MKIRESVDIVWLVEKIMCLNLQNVLKVLKDKEINDIMGSADKFFWCT